MGLISHDVFNFRNLHQAHIDPGAGLNLITGPNASGKTSLLESIFYLSYGRSFRNAQVRDLIEYQQDYFRLISKITADDRISHLGIEKSPHQQKIKLNKEPVTRLTDLSLLLPVVAIHPDSHHLISAGPDNRRQYMDWGVFHVEHSFLHDWKTYKTALSQRNAALRTQQPDKLCQLWNPVLIESAEAINRARSHYLERLNHQINHFSSFLFPESTIDINYRKGWVQELDLAAILHDQLDRDKQKGFTQHGPHRADLKITVDGKSAQTSISRGQQKKLVALLKLSQMNLFLNDSDKTCVLLYDDLPAELDAANQTILMELLSAMNVQAFISAINISQLTLDSWSSVKMFHVEQGEISV
ncbi:MAG: DNA replication/repair protein RecF [Gammaproteobacteria bacterium]